jgi:hypothetical protein
MPPAEIWTSTAVQVEYVAPERAKTLAQAAIIVLLCIAAWAVRDARHCQYIDFEVRIIGFSKLLY